MPSEGSRTNAVIWVVAGLIAVFALVRLTSSHDGGGGSPVRIDRAPSAAPARGHKAIYVHVAGAVRQPGLLKLTAGSRVATAVQRAGGPAPHADLSGVNLAARLEDGQQVIVPLRGGPGSATGAAGSATGAAVPGAGVPGTGVTGTAAPGAAGVPKISLGSATVEQLDQIDGIGPTLALRIIEYRTQHGGFGSIGELREVEGIGEKRFETLREALQP